MRFTNGPRGSSVTASIPGTGISYHKATNNGAAPANIPGVEPPSHLLVPIQSENRTVEFKSAAIDELTSPALREFKPLLLQARDTYRDTIWELNKARAQEITHVRRCESWTNGWFFRKVFKEKYEEIRELAQDSIDRRLELDEQEKLSRVQAEFDVPAAAIDAFSHMRDAFTLMLKSERIWDTLTQRSIDRAMRASAKEIVTLASVKFDMRHCDIVGYEIPVPYLANANGGDLFLYPGFILYFMSTENFGLLEYRDLKLTFEYIRFVEKGRIPSDAKIIGETWAKTNKDGSQDRRFKENYSIPVVEYGTIRLESVSGLNEQYMVSNAKSADEFAAAWNDFVHSFYSGATSGGIDG